MTLKLQPSKTLLASLCGAALAAGLGLFLHTFAFGLELIYQSYNFLLVGRGDRPVSGAVLVYLDEASHLRLNQSLMAPWDRALHAQLVERLTAAGAKAIVFDIVFSDPNINNPAADQRLAEAIKKSGRVFLAAESVVTGPKTTQVLRPFDLMLDSVAGIGSSDLLPSRDLVVREMTRGELIPTLSEATAEFAAGRSLPAEPGRGRRWLNYYGPAGFLPWVSYYEALDPKLSDDGLFRDKVVFVGARLQTKFAGERRDEYPGPFSSWVTQSLAAQRGSLFISGVEIHATAFLNLWRGEWLRRLSPAMEKTLLLGFGILCGFGLVWLRPLVATAVAGAGFILASTTCYYGLFLGRATWFPWMIPTAQIAMALGWSIIFNSIQLYVQKCLYEHTLGLYLSPKLVRKFSSNPSLLQRGAAEQTLTLCFTDIAEFTGFSQGMSSTALAQLMNHYFHAAVSNCIHATDGTVVKFIGDAIFAFWNAPEPQPDHAARACEAALRFREHGLHSFNSLALHTRIGIHTGVANVGNFGSLDRVDYTALGDSVNLASRLEGLNKFIGTICLVSGATQAELGGRFVTRPVGRFQLKGFETAVEAFELVGHAAEDEETRPWREIFAQALRDYQCGHLEAAHAGFERTLELRPGDGPARFYLARLASPHLQTRLGRWTGTVELTEK